MNFDTLKYFIELSRTGSFYRAADNVFISQQGLNKAITGLEKELGMKLIERCGRQGVRLTERGDMFLIHAEKLLEDYHVMMSCLFETPSSSTSDSESINITTTYYLLQTLTSLQDSPALLKNASLHEMPFWQILEAVENSSGDELFIADIHPQSTQLLEDSRSVAFEPIFSTQLGLMRKEGSLPDLGDLVHREEVRDLPFALSSEKEIAKWVEWVFRDHPLSNVKLRTTNVRLLMDFVLTGQFSTFDSYGFKLVSKRNDSPVQGLRFTPFATPDATVRVGFLFNKNARPDARCRTYMDLLKRLFE